MRLRRKFSLLLAGTLVAIFLCAPSTTIGQGNSFSQLVKAAKAKVEKKAASSSSP